MVVKRTSAAISVIEGGGKLRNGLFLRRIALYDDRIVFEVFASRPLGEQDLARLSLTDDSGTRYEMTPLETGVIDGQGCIEFTPAATTGWSGLHLGEPGWGLHVMNELA